MVFIVALLLGVLVASFVEYAVHRLMHAGLINARKHAEHHRDGWGQGFWPELGDYLLPGAPLLLPPWFISLEAGAGWTAGSLGYAAFSAWAHQLQHEHPAACRWMWKHIPAHYVHHRDHMWEHNFGLGVDWWDHVFGTWRAVPFGSVLEIESEQASPLDIHWRRTEGEGQPLARITERPPAARC